MTTTAIPSSLPPKSPMHSTSSVPTSSKVPSTTTTAAHFGLFTHNANTYNSVTPIVEVGSLSDLFIKSNLIGEGGYAKVYTAIDRKTGETRALKIMDRFKMSEKAKAMVVHEKEVLKRVSHPSIVRLYQCVQTEAEICFELDLMQTDLFEYIVETKKRNGNKGGMDEDDVAYVMTQLLSAVAYLHENNIVHRDIKPENILINGPADIKLADFGLAKVVEGPPRRNTPMGTSYYIAPEIIRSIEMQSTLPQTTTREAVKAVDIWACGIVLAFMLSGKPPFMGQIRTGAERRALLNNIDRGVIFHNSLWEGVSSEAKDLVAALLEQNHMKRITAYNAMKHPFFERFGPKKFEKMYAHIPQRENEDDAQPVIISGPCGDCDDDCLRDDVGSVSVLKIRAPTIIEIQRHPDFHTPTVGFSRASASLSFSNPAPTQGSPQINNGSFSNTPSFTRQHSTAPINNTSFASAASAAVAAAAAASKMEKKDDEYHELKNQLDEMHFDILGDEDSFAMSPRDNTKDGSPACEQHNCRHCHFASNATHSDASVDVSCSVVSSGHASASNLTQQDDCNNNNSHASDDEHPLHLSQQDRSSNSRHAFCHSNGEESESDFLSSTAAYIPPSSLNSESTSPDSSTVKQRKNFALPGQKKKSSLSN